MAVYFIQATESGRIKIGHGASPERRRANLQIGCPEPLILTAVIPGDARTEAELHSRFAEHRIRGEWFKPASEVVAFVKALAPFTPAVTMKPRNGDLESFRGLIGLWPSDEAFADDHGITIGAAALWKHRGGIPPTHWSLTIRGAAKRRIKGITLDLLAALARKRAEAGKKQRKVA